MKQKGIVEVIDKFYAFTEYDSKKNIFSTLDKYKDKNINREEINKKLIDKLINIVGKRTHKDRMEIRSEYKRQFNSDLMSEFINHFNGDYKMAMLAIFTDPVEYDVDSIYKAIKKKEEDTLIEILTSRPGFYLNKIKEIYKKKYKKELENDLIEDNSSDLRKLLVYLLQKKRSINEKPNKDECIKKAEKLKDLDDFRGGRIDKESVFKEILALSSPHELACISREYHKLTNNMLTTAIDDAFSGDKKKLFKTILYALISPSEYFATRIHEAISESKTNKSLLTRILVTRAEIDLARIKQYYLKLYNKNIIDDINNDVSGNYKR